MMHSYELDIDDIRDIIAEKFNCSKQFVCLRSEKEHIFSGCRETIKATVKVKVDIQDSEHVLDLAPKELVEIESIKKSKLDTRLEGIEEKRVILQRLKDYRAAHGTGCLSLVSEKTSRKKKGRLSVETLRDIVAGNVPKMDLSEWRKISKALYALEGAALKDE